MNTTAEAIEKLIRSDEARYGKIAAQAGEECKKLIRSFRDQADWYSGWSHHFACPDCAANLIYDPDLDFNPPNRFVCPNCGKEVSGQAMDEAWVYFYRQDTAARLEAVAVCALQGNEEARSFMEAFFDFYAGNYAAFPLHGHEGGKIMPQILDEAVWCILAMRGLYPCRKLFSPEKKAFWYEKLFLPLATLIDDPIHQKHLHNHVLWYKAAVGAIGLCFEDQALLDHALNGERGIREHAEQGFTKEGFWQEGSPFYHYYTLEALTGFCQFFADQYPNDPLLLLLERVYLSPLRLSFDSWTLPSINDGWFPLPLHKFADQFHRAARASGSEKLIEYAEKIREKDPQAFDKASSLLLDPPPVSLEIWESTKLAVIRKPFFAILKSGAIIRSHMHRDFLSLIIPPFSKDLGTPGYGHALYKSWYQLAAAHNTLTVDGDQSHYLIPTHVESCGEGVKAVIDGGWDVISSAHRILTPKGDTLRDEMEIVCPEEHQLDWIFHAEGQAEFSVQPGEEAFAGQEWGYEYLTDVKRIPCGDMLKVSFTLENSRLTLTLDTRGMEVLTARSPGNPADLLRTAVILRMKGKTARFLASYQVESL